jgi:hypothetical protein
VAPWHKSNNLTGQPRLVFWVGLGRFEFPPSSENGCGLRPQLPK